MFCIIWQTSRSMPAASYHLLQSCSSFSHGHKGPREDMKASTCTCTGSPALFGCSFAQHTVLPVAAAAVQQPARAPDTPPSCSHTVSSSQCCLQPRTSKAKEGPEPGPQRGHQDFVECSVVHVYIFCYTSCIAKMQESWPREQNLPASESSASAGTEPAPKVLMSHCFQ